MCLRRFEGCPFWGSRLGGSEGRAGICPRKAARRFAGPSAGARVRCLQSVLPAVGPE